MKSAVPKVLHPVCGRALVAWPIEAAREAGAGRIGVIVSPDRDISGALPDGIETIPQPEANGTGGALRAAAAEVVGESETVVVLSGDVPLVSAELIADLLATHESSGAAATVVTAVLDDPGTYGRVVRTADGIGGRADRRGQGRRRRDRGRARDPRDQRRHLRLRRRRRSPRCCRTSSNDNAQGEYYLPDVLPLLTAAGGHVVAHVSDDPNVILGVNSRVDLARDRGGGAAPDPRAPHARRGDDRRSRLDLDRGRRRDRARRPDRARLLADRRHAGSGPARSSARTRRSSTRAIGADVHVPALLPGRVRGRRPLQRRPVRLPAAEGRARRGREGGHVRRDQELADRRRARRCRTSPTSATPTSATAPTSAPRRSPPTTTASSRTGQRSGTVREPSVDTTLIAPVEIGDSAYTGAGSVINEDVPPGALGITRARADQHRRVTPSGRPRNTKRSERARPR